MIVVHWNCGETINSLVATTCSCMLFDGEFTMREAIQTSLRFSFSLWPYPNVSLEAVEKSLFI